MKILTVFALPQEVVEISSREHEIHRLVTGVGKAWAAVRLTEALIKLRPEAVINIGTAGTLRHDVGDILVGTHFVDRDYERLRLPGLDHELTTVFPQQLRLPSLLHGTISEQAFTINTGDDFVTAAEPITGDVVDMEAYAEALACGVMSVPFVSVKCVTDIIGQNSVGHWEEKLEEARERLTDYFKRYIR